MPRRNWLLATVVAGVALFFFASGSAKALSGADWRAGRIIDDGVFTNKNALGPDGIQTFLNRMVGTGGYGRIAGQCDTNGVATSELGGGTRAQYGAAHGNPTPFTCLKDYYEVPKTSPGPGVPASNYGGAPIPAGAESAAQLIWDAAQRYTINPEVLLVMIQKESAGPLITDDWPFKSQYTFAMGAHCPDSTGCDPNYAGFSIQISESAALLRYYLNNMTQPWWPYKKVGNNSIQYNPSTSCGSSNVSIETMATAGLYTYTPYQPNAAALSVVTDNSPGGSVPCGAYGNRNFWWYFSKWFGTTSDDPFAWRVQDLHIYDEAKNIELGTDNLHAGERVFVSLRVENTGREIWYRDGPNPIELGTDRPENHNSIYCDSTWISCDRVTKLKEAQLNPLETGTFEFYASASNVLGQFREYFRPVLENRAWMSNDEGFHIYTKTVANYPWGWGSFDAWTDQAKTTPANLDNLSRNQTLYINLRAVNRSDTVWTNSGPNPLKLGTSNPQDRNSILCTNTWLSCNRAALMNEASVAPGQTATFSFTIKTPGQLGVYREYFKPVLEFKGWTQDDLNHIYLNVTQ